MRHDQVRDIIAEHTREIHNDVETEPTLTPLTGETLQYRSATSADDARTDIRANGFWSRQQSAFSDVRIFYPQAPSYRDQRVYIIYVCLTSMWHSAYTSRQARPHTIVFRSDHFDIFFHVLLKFGIHDATCMLKTYSKYVVHTT